MATNNARQWSAAQPPRSARGGRADGRSIVTKFLGRRGRGTGSRVEGRHFIKLWYEGVYIYGTINYYVGRDPDSSGSISSGPCVYKNKNYICATDEEINLPNVAKMASHAIFQYNVLAIDDTHNTWTNIIVKDKHSQAFRFK